ncbi:uncharacterized protein [Lepisosteus oculatus]|uniref:uncharacterized protein isoform X1 n=2 Tax=Lepisosteus oculatus TaxID=7918 RepID=UPI00371B82D9
MLAHQPLQCLACGPPNLFETIVGDGITFVLDTSGSMYLRLRGVKEQLVRALFRRAGAQPQFSFNIVEFNSEVRKWRNRCVPSSLLALSQAASWIHCLESQSVSDSRATLTALRAAQEDPACHSVCLVTDGLPDSPLCAVNTWLQPRPPVHVIYLSYERGQSSPTWLLQEIASRTGGTFSVSALAEGIAVPWVCIPTCCSRFGGAGLPVTDMCKSLHSQLPVTSAVESSSFDGASGGFKLVRGARVLARRHQDGLYYLGYLCQEVQGVEKRFVVEFDQGRWFRSRAGGRLQEIRLSDLLHLAEAQRHPVSPGDAVLAPWEASACRYGPGTVLLGRESRSPLSDSQGEEQGLVVNFWNGRTESVPQRKAIKIPRQLYDFLVLELQMPASARRSLLQSVQDFPREAPPGYRSWGSRSAPPPFAGGCRTRTASETQCRPGATVSDCPMGSWEMAQSVGDTRARGQGRSPRESEPDTSKPSVSVKKASVVRFQGGKSERGVSRGTKQQRKEYKRTKNREYAAPPGSHGAQNTAVKRAENKGGSQGQCVEPRVEKAHDEWRQWDCPNLSSFSRTSSEEPMESYKATTGFPLSHVERHRQMFDRVHEALKRDQKAMEAAVGRVLEGRPHCKVWKQ